MKKILVVLIVAIFCCSLVACDQKDSDINQSASASLTDGNEENENKNGSFKEDTKLSATALNIAQKKCIVAKEANYADTVVSFFDDKYNYWIFDMGYLIDVPLEEAYSYYKYNGGNIEYKFSTARTNAQSLKNLTEKISSKSSNWTTTDTHEVGIGVKFGEKDVWEVSIGLGYTHSNSNSSSIVSTWSESFEKCESYTETQENSVVISFDDNCEKGYYRYVLLGVVNVYAAVIQDRTTQEYYANTYTEIKAYGYSLDFDKDSPLFDDYDDKSLEFDLSLVGDLTQPTEYVSPDELNNGLEPLVVFNETIRTGDCKIAGSGKYTLDVFTLEKTIAALMETGYTKLVISINYDLKEVDNCKQYVSLFTSTDYIIRKETIEHGGSSKQTSWGTHLMECEIELEKLDSNIFNFKVQAENAIFKDFYIGTVSVRIVAV